jgi:membrane protease YdiL (CAAX protease family)
MVVITAVPFAFAHLPLALFTDFTPGSLAGSLLLYLILGVLVRPMLAVVGSLVASVMAASATRQTIRRRRAMMSAPN